MILCLIWYCSLWLAYPAGERELTRSRLCRNPFRYYGQPDETDNTELESIAIGADLVLNDVTKIDDRTLVATVSNDGLRPVDEWTLAVLPTNTSVFTSPVVWEETITPILATGEERVITMTLSAAITDTYSVWVDPYNEVLELIEWNNNRGFGTYVAPQVEVEPEPEPEPEPTIPEPQQGQTTFYLPLVRR